MSTKQSNGFVQAIGLGTSVHPVAVQVGTVHVNASTAVQSVESGVCVTVPAEQLSTVQATPSSIVGNGGKLHTLAVHTLLVHALLSLQSVAAKHSTHRFMAGIAATTRHCSPAAQPPPESHAMQVWVATLQRSSGAEQPPLGLLLRQSTHWLF
jgi:hypothetical protein